MNCNCSPSSSSSRMEATSQPVNSAAAEISVSKNVSRVDEEPRRRITSSRRSRRWSGSLTGRTMRESIIIRIIALFVKIYIETKELS